MSTVCRVPYSYVATYDCMIGAVLWTRRSFIILVILFSLVLLLEYMLL